MLHDNHVLRVFHDAQAPTTPNIASNLPLSPMFRRMQQIPHASCRTQEIYIIMLLTFPLRPFLPSCALSLAVGRLQASLTVTRKFDSRGLLRPHSTLPATVLLYIVAVPGSLLHAAAPVLSFLAPWHTFQ